jgi:hypothetical protein
VPVEFLLEEPQINNNKKQKAMVHGVAKSRIPQVVKDLFAEED